MNVAFGTNVKPMPGKLPDISGKSPTSRRDVHNEYDDLQQHDHNISINDQRSSYIHQ